LKSRVAVFLSLLALVTIAGTLHAKFGPHGIGGSFNDSKTWADAFRQLPTILLIALLAAMGLSSLAPIGKSQGGEKENAGASANVPIDMGVQEAADNDWFFKFEPKWKEELVCTAPQGSLILELPMGELTALLPTENVWKEKAPSWARELWPVLKKELEEWCVIHKARFLIDPTANVGQ
jgi:hypothetical protein